MEFLEIKQEMRELALDTLREYLTYSIDTTDEFDADILREELETGIDRHQWVIYNRYHWEICPYIDRTDAADYLDDIGGVDATFAEKGLSGVLMLVTYAILREIAVGFLEEITDLVEYSIDNETPLNRNSTNELEREVATAMMNSDLWGE